ncbi:helix-turn-helix domain-containing protein [Actinoplanes palleronii]|uniref:Transcriptional regulator n=1 Tax=Actinoplanes palleronii TaxID=113570 RepID=A0ABQ4BS30_9ACTN|nr:helix-turn-helix transcriptional regulator [Actinoplanes palleronii]GIE73494.1 transcriptional regulator [Actinoplanes palleronii]
MVNPTIQRRRLGIALKRARENAGLTQDEAAEAIDSASSKISRIELGQSGLRSIDLTLLLRAYNVPDDVAVSMRELAKAGRQRGRWSNYREQLPSWFRTFVDLESDAAEIRQYQTEIIPGVLQTEAYVRAILTNGWSPDEAALAQQVDIRLKRQTILDGDVELAFVLSESVLRRMVGGPATMRAQMSHLVELSRRPAVTIQVLPFNAQTYVAPSFNFVILRFGPDSTTDVIYTESFTDADYLDRPDQVRAYTKLWDDLRAAAIGPAESRALIEQLGDLS